MEKIMWIIYLIMWIISFIAWIYFVFNIDKENYITYVWIALAFMWIFNILMKITK